MVNANTERDPPARGQSVTGSPRQGTNMVTDPSEKMVTNAAVVDVGCYYLAAADRFSPFQARFRQRYRSAIKRDER